MLFYSDEDTIVPRALFFLALRQTGKGPQGMKFQEKGKNYFLGTISFLTVGTYGMVKVVKEYEPKLTGFIDTADTHQNTAGSF